MGSPYIQRSKVVDNRMLNPANFDFATQPQWQGGNKMILGALYGVGSIMPVEVIKIQLAAY